MFVEIGHFYANQYISYDDLEYLKNQTFQDDDILCIFIDNYFVPKSPDLDLMLLVTYISNIVKCHVKLCYESDMVQFFDLGLSKLDQQFVERHSINGVDTILTYKGKKIYDYATKRPTCQMLSYLWTMYRLGVFDNVAGKYQQVLTVIDQKYMKLETRVLDMIPVDLRKYVFYRFFKP